MGFSEKEIGHMTPKKYNLLAESYKKFYNFKAQNQLFKDENSNDEEWIT